MNPFGSILNYIKGGGGASAGGSYGTAKNNNVGKEVSSAIGFDPTPGFNVTKSAPFVGSSANGGAAPAGGGGGSAPAAPKVVGNQAITQADPYAAYGGTQAYNALRSGYGAQRDSIFGSVGDAAGNAGIGYNSSILDFLDSLKAGQTSIDRQGVQNELAKRQGTAQVMDSVGHGLRSGGVMLANKNASNSSAGDALGQAYADIGRRQLSQVGNQYEQGRDSIHNAQIDLEGQKATGQRKLGESKTQVVNGIVSDAQSKLSALDAQIAGAALPDRINIEQAKEQVRQQTLAALQQYDQVLQSGLQGIGPMGQDAARGEAARLATAGTAADNAFDFTTDTPTQFQNTGPFASDLPFFSARQGRKQLA